MIARRVDFNSLLQLANLLVAAALLYVAFSLQTQVHVYINERSAWLGLLLSLQVQAALVVERRRRDPFVLLLCFSLIIYFALRIFTLYLYPTSAVFNRFNYGPQNTNFALVFILIANLFLYAGLYFVKLPAGNLVEAGERRATSPTLVLGLLAFTVMITYLGGRSDGNVPRAIAALAVLLSPLMIVTMALVYWFLFRHTLSRGFKWALGGLIVVEMVAHTLWGSRSAVIGFVQMYLLVTFAVFGAVYINRRLVILCTLLAPLIMVVLAGTFAISTYQRMVKNSGATFDFATAVNSIDDVTAEMFEGAAAQVLIGNVFARAGFLDFSAEVIANRERYSRVVNLPAYARSLIDNIVTPGFDLFDQPKISNSLLFVYRDWGAPSKRSVDTVGGYQSDQLGIFGELYVLFGYGSLPVFFLLAWLIKWIFFVLRDNNPYLLAMKRVIVLTLFVRTLDSFGIDWTIGETLPLLVATFLYSALFASRSTADLAVSEGRLLVKS